MSTELTPAAVDPAWLTRRLRAAGVLREAAVTHVAAEPVGVGMLGESLRFACAYDRDEGAPPSFVGKFASGDPTSRQTGMGFGLYPREVAFYREIAATVAIRTPACWFAEIDEADGTFALLLEDLTPARAGNQLTGCDLVDAEAAMEQAAALHGPRWGDAALKANPTLDTTAARLFVAQVFGDCLAEFHRRYDGVLEPEYMGVADRYGGIVAALMAAPDDGGPFTITHGDFRLDNMLFDAGPARDPLVVLDWQSPAVGNGATDVAYFLAMALPIELRRRSERDLLALYLDRLHARGVRDYAMADLERDYRRTAFLGISTAIFASASTKRTERGDAMFLAMARGGAALVLDVDAFDAVGLG